MKPKHEIKKWRDKSEGLVRQLQGMDRAFKAEKKRLHDALWEYGRHKRDCKGRIMKTGREQFEKYVGCTCGYHEALGVKE